MAGTEERTVNQGVLKWGGGGGIPRENQEEVSRIANRFRQKILKKSQSGEDVRGGGEKVGGGPEGRLKGRHMGGVYARQYTSRKHCPWQGGAIQEGIQRISLLKRKKMDSVIVS